MYIYLIGKSNEKSSLIFLNFYILWYIFIHGFNNMLKYTSLLIYTLLNCCIKGPFGFYDTVVTIMGAI